MLSKIKRIVKSNRVLYAPIRLIYKIRAKKQIKYFQAHGYSVNEQVYKVLTGKYEYYCAAGTLLGIVREKEFIAFDDDLDYLLCIDPGNIERFCSFMKENGFLLRHVYYTEGIIRELGFIYNKISVDFFIVFENGNSVDVYWYYRSTNRAYANNEVSTVILNMPSIQHQSNIIVSNSSHFPIPVNYEEILSFWYGRNWQVPIRGIKAETDVGNRKKFEDKISYAYRELQ